MLGDVGVVCVGKIYFGVGGFVGCVGEICVWCDCGEYWVVVCVGCGVECVVFVVVVYVFRGWSVVVIGGDYWEFFVVCVLFDEGVVCGVVGDGGIVGSEYCVWNLEFVGFD